MNHECSAMEPIPSPQITSRSAPPRPEGYIPLAQFTLNLIKSILRTGYYSADHPEAQKGLADLYAQFRQLIEDRSELTYMVMMTGDDQAITIDGYDSAPLSLDRVMRQNMTDLFTPKFLEFFGRWNLLSFSVKANISAEEFHAFIVLMSQAPDAGRGTKEASERLLQAFLDQHILHVSTVFSDEMVGKERRLPWRLKMALSRLRRDLRMLPLYTHATPEEIQRIKLQIIDDVIRPVRTAGLLKEFLINCDLVAADMAELDEAQIRRGILRSLSEEMLVATAEELVKDLERQGSIQGTRLTECTSEEMARRLNLLREVAALLCTMGGTLGHDLLESLLKHQVLSLEEMPPDIQYAVETRRLAESFMGRVDEHMGHLCRIEPGEAGRELVALVHRIVPELLRRREYQTVGKILQTVNEGRQVPTTSPVLEELAEQLSQAIAAEGTIGQLLKDLHCQDKDRRTHLVEILAFIGDQAGPGLLEAYATSESKSVRLSAFEALRRIGTSVLEPFLARLWGLEREGPVICHILAVLAEQGDAALAQPICRFLHHANVHVREAALRALAKLQGPGAEGHFLHALRDREGALRQTAVAYLAHIKSRHPQALEAYASALQRDDPSAPPENDATLIHVCQALASFARLSVDHIGKAETILLAGLRPVKQKRLLSWFKKPSYRHSERVRAAICDALADIGTCAAVDALRQVAEIDSAPVAEKAAAAAAQIQERSSQRPSAARRA